MAARRGRLLRVVCGVCPHAGRPGAHAPASLPLCRNAGPDVLPTAEAAGAAGPPETARPSAEAGWCGRARPGGGDVLLHPGSELLGQIPPGCSFLSGDSKERRGGTFLEDGRTRGGEASFF